MVTIRVNLHVVMATKNPESDMTQLRSILLLLNGPQIERSSWYHGPVSFARAEKIRCPVSLHAPPTWPRFAILPEQREPPKELYFHTRTHSFVMAL